MSTVIKKKVAKNVVSDLLSIKFNLDINHNWNV